MSLHKQLGVLESGYKHTIIVAGFDIGSVIGSHSVAIGVGNTAKPIVEMRNGLLCYTRELEERQKAALGLAESRI